MLSVVISLMADVIGDRGLLHENIVKIHKSFGWAKAIVYFCNTILLNMKRAFFCFLCLFAVSLITDAQQAWYDIKNNPNLAGSNYVAYHGPHKRLAPAPKGYEPYYISHYGRHGSRYLINSSDYDKPFFVLSRADSLGKLTLAGREVLRKVGLIREEAKLRGGELTSLGVRQHHAIARRMILRFPTVFSGDASVDARSTTVIRCILSMESALQELVAHNPHLRVCHDASRHDMYYMNDQDNKYCDLRDTPQTQAMLRAFQSKHVNYNHLMRYLFNDSAYAGHIDAADMGTRLFNLAANVQSTELRHQISLWDIFTDEERYNTWRYNNVGWYIYSGPCKQVDGAGMYTQVNLLKNIIFTADSCLLLPHPGVTLRYGHEVNVLPLVCLLNLNGYGEAVDDLEQLDMRGWNNYDIFPMACNVQFIFYKPQKGMPTAANALVKVLLNEDECTLPIPTDCAPCYHWQDVRAYFLNRISGK